MYFPLKIELQSPTPSSELPKCFHPRLSHIGQACFIGRFLWNWVTVLKVTSCSMRFIRKLFPARTESRGGETWEQRLWGIWEEMMSLRFGSGAERGACVYLYFGGGVVLGCACWKEGVSHLSAKKRSLTIADLHCCSAAATLVQSVHNCCHVGFPNRLWPPLLISERDLYRVGCTHVTKEGLQSLAESNCLCLTETCSSYLEVHRVVELK